MTHVAIPPVDAKAVDATRAAGIRRTVRNGAIAGTFLIKKNLIFLIQFQLMFCSVSKDKN